MKSVEIIYNQLSSKDDNGLSLDWRNKLWKQVVIGLEISDVGQEDASLYEVKK